MNGDLAAAGALKKAFCDLIEFINLLKLRFALTKAKHGLLFPVITTVECSTKNSMSAIIVVIN